MMITPWVQVEALPGDAEETCHVVRLANEFEGPLADDPEGIAAAQFNIQFIKTGSFLVSDGALYHPFAWDRETLEGQKLELAVTVRGDGYEGTKSVSIVLEGRNPAKGRFEAGDEGGRSGGRVRFGGAEVATCA